MAAVWQRRIRAICQSRLGTQAIHNLVPIALVPLDQRSKNERLWEQPFWNNKGNNRILSIRLHCAVCIYAWNGCSPSLSFSDRWSRGPETLGTRLGNPLDQSKHIRARGHCGSTTDWTTNWRDFSEPITYHSNAKPQQTNVSACT